MGVPSGMIKLTGNALISCADAHGMKNIATRMHADILRRYAVGKKFRLYWGLKFVCDGQEWLKQVG